MCTLVLLWVKDVSGIKTKYKMLHEDCVCLYRADASVTQSQCQVRSSNKNVI